MIAERLHSVKGSQRFRAEDRVRKSREYARSRAEGRRVSSRYWAVESTPNGLERARLGLVVARRVGCAVARNRIKRAVREWFRQRRETLRAADYVVIARNGAASLSTRLAWDELSMLTGRAQQ